MARKESAGEANQGFGEVIGIVLIALAALFFAALFTYDLKDVSANTATPNPVPHNAIGLFGAWSASKLFFLFGAAAYLVPPLLLLFGVAQYVKALGFLTRRWLWSIPLMLCFMGELDLLYQRFGSLNMVRQNVNALSPGGLFGLLLNGHYAFGIFGHVGASIFFITIYLISLLYLTNFQLFGWLSAMVQSLRHPEEKPFSAEGLSEKDLEKKAKELSKQARKLQDEMERKNADEPEKEPAKAKGKEEADPEKMVAEKSGLGADGLPVPEPTVRDLSVPQPRPIPETAKATELVSDTKPEPEPKRKSKSKNEPVLEGEVISAREFAAATTEDILGRKSAAKAAEEDEKPPFDIPESELPAGPSEENPFAAPVVVAANAPAVPIAAPVPAPLPVPSLRNRPTPKKPKPITVASTPMIGNYTMPSMELLHYPDMTVKPTESREELMANARLMQQTLAQFDIEVALGDITTGPTITRYELHPAPGVKLEKIAGLTNNIAAALKA